ncbi:TPA: conjugative transfer ATPase [Klebsiella quasipneumoniae subsp. quasipneumoniae]|nr:conjugative transfer ATPase [Klebsiella quasipneumoniae subsp. similipneumoniae]HBR1460301.1 conjugative transfer ATPase [Klebsiella quasipneumoniae subsp. quasipneumoniae]HBR2034410.1 conjugative transfer ATPase [Klebsiella quasipneumoniae subsp. quasipneumoniae]
MIFNPWNSPSPPDDPASSWQRFIARLKAHAVPVPGSLPSQPATRADEEALYHTAPSFTGMLPWVEYLPENHSLLLDDGVSQAAFFELTPLSTEGREPDWLLQARDALENIFQDCLEESDTAPWVVQIYASDECDWRQTLASLRDYIHPRAKNSAFSERYLSVLEQHLHAISQPGGLFCDTAVTRLPWRGRQRRVRMVIWRREPDGNTQGIPAVGQALSSLCQRLENGLSGAGIKTCRMDAATIHDWLLRWFNPHPTHLGNTEADRERFYDLTRYPPATEDDKPELDCGVDFSQRLFFSQPRSDVQQGVWYFDNLPHRVIVIDRLRTPPAPGHITGESRRGDAINTVFDQMPENVTLCLTLMATPQDLLETHLNQLSKKAVGDTLASEQTRQDVQEARSLIGKTHKLYRGALAFYLHGRDDRELADKTLQLNGLLLNAGLQPVREQDEVAPLNSYLRWLPAVFNPMQDKHQWYTQLMFVQHAVNLAPLWGRSIGTGHPGITLFNRGGAPLCFDPLNRLDRQMNAHLFLFGPTGSGKSATLNAILHQITAVYRPRLFIAEVGNSFGLSGDFARQNGLSVHRIKLAPGSGVSLAPFADAYRLVEMPSQVQTLDSEALDDDGTTHDEKRDVLGELEIIARLMITGGEEKEEARMTRADRSLIRQCILDAAQLCVSSGKPVLTCNVRDALRRKGNDETQPEIRRNRLLEMAEAMDMFCQGVDGEMFDRPGTPWPEADITIVDLATFAREGYNAQLSIAWISLINTVNNIAERDQFSGRPIINVTDEGHIITRNALLAPYAVKITKMWRKINCWFWLATQNLDDLPEAAQPMLNMIEWWICLSMPPDEVEKIARFRELSPAQKTLMLSARKEAGKFTEGVVLSRSMEALFRAVPPSLYLALAMTEPEEKAERYRLMQEHGISELEAALRVAEKMDVERGIIF